MFRRQSNKRIINEIISNTSTAAIILTVSDGNMVNFYSELSNFYKKSYWLNPYCEDFYSFAISFAKKVFCDSPEEYEKILQFKHCAYGRNKDTMIIKEALRKIGTIYGDCLLVIDNLEQLKGGYDSKVLEFILKNSPRNLKILLVSENFIDINYNIFSEQCPKLIEVNNDGEDEVVLRDLSYEESSLLCSVAPLRFVDKAFLPYIGVDTDVMDNLAKKYPDYVLRRGDSGYCVNEKFYSVCDLSEKGTLSSDIQTKYYEYLIGSGNDMDGLLFGIRCGRRDWVGESAKAIVTKGAYTFELCNFVNANIGVLNEMFSEVTDMDGYEFVHGLLAYYRKDYDGSIEIFKRVSSLTDSKKLGLDATYMVVKNLVRKKHYLEGLNMANRLIAENLRDGSLDVGTFEMLLCKIPVFLKEGEFVTNRENCRFFESLVMKEENESKYWYPKALQVLAEMHFGWGNYAKATEYIKKVQENIPFYVIPYRLMGFYYYMDDMPMAVSMAKKALSEELINNIEPDLMDVYTLLAKTSIYYNKYAEALEYIDNAIKSEAKNELAKYRAYCIRAMICAKMNKRDYARDYAMIYAKHAELNSSKYAYYLYGAVAYCSFRQNDFDTAALYANKAIKEASAHTGVWLVAVAVAINILITKDETNNANMLMEKLFRTCRVYNMGIIMLDYYDCFEKLFKYAKEEGIEREYVEEMERKHKEKMMSISANGELNVKLMGTTSVTVSGKELNWKTKKAKELFLMYVYHRGEGVDRNYILSTLWPDYVYVSAINNLKTTNNIIRNILNSANVIHKLEYANGKYTLILDNIQCDYITFVEKMSSYDDSMPVKKRVEVMKDLIAGLNGDFAAEITLPLFRKTGESLKEKIMLDAIKLISELIASGDIIEARRLISIASKADNGGKFAHLIAEQEKRITEYFERKD